MYGWVWSTPQNVQLKCLTFQYIWYNLVYLNLQNFVYSKQDIFILFVEMAIGDVWMIPEAVQDQNWTPIPFKTNETQIQSQNNTNWNNHFMSILANFTKGKKKDKSKYNAIY